MGLWNRKGTVRCDKGTERQRWMVIRCKLKPASTIFSILESSVYTGPWICIMKLQQWMVNCALKILAGNSEDQARYTFNLWVVLNGVMKCHAALHHPVFKRIPQWVLPSCMSLCSHLTYQIVVVFMGLRQVPLK